MHSFQKLFSCKWKNYLLFILDLAAMATVHLFGVEVATSNIICLAVLNQVDVNQVEVCHKFVMLLNKKNLWPVLFSFHPPQW